MKLLLATCADANVEEYSQYTIPIFHKYAEKWGAELLRLDRDYLIDAEGHGMWNYRTLDFYNLFEMYDRILYLDADIIINKNCPNIFEYVPERLNTIALVMEDKGSRLKNRRNKITKIKRYFGGCENWRDGYMNGGFYLVSKIHRDIFQKIDGKVWHGKGYDSGHYMYQIFKYGFRYVDLGFKFNHMAMFSEPWNGSPSRFDSHLIHYAGRANFPDRNERSRTELIRNDIRKIYG